MGFTRLLLRACTSGRAATATTCAVAAVSLVCICTFAITSWRFWRGSIRYHSREHFGDEPPTLPHWIPWLGSSLSYTTNVHGFLKAKYPHGRLWGVRLGSIYAYLITGSHNVKKVFRNAHHLDFEFFIVNVSTKVWRMPLHDARELEKDSSGPGAQPLGDVDGGGRIWLKLRDIYRRNWMTGGPASRLAARWISEFLANLGSPHEVSLSPPEGQEWALVPVYKFLRAQMLMATTMTLAGPHFLEECPTFATDLWDYDEAFFTLLLGTPWFLCRRGWDARDRLLAATKRWLVRAWAEYDWQDGENQTLEWEPLFGHQVVRERERVLKDYGMSLDGRAAMQAGMIWAASINAVPAAGWMIIQILRDPDLYRRIRAEVMAANVITESGGKTHLDTDKLITLPLLLSVHLECLRLYASVPVTRSLRNDVEIDGHKLLAGNYVIAPSYIAHTNERTWSTQGHPASTFFAERFIRRKDTDETSKQEPGDFFPYGGGLNLCPGRHIGKQEIFAAVALLLVKFDFEFVGYIDKKGRPTSQWPEVFNYEACESRGMIQPDLDVLMRMRKACMD
ncbi:MAG: hypothetical protein M1840_000825 [Geoglossum simile]|nr:MAG: hypothetical protein M1840_000825 [Geoglossum simile]